MRFLLSLLVLILFSLSHLSGQYPIYLQLEEVNKTEVIKYYPGQKIRFTTKEYPDAWRTERIEKIIPEENLIVLSTGFIKPEEIHSIQRKNGGVLVAGHMFSKFAAGWLVYGAYASIVDSGYKMSLTEVIIGAVLGSVGWLFRKLFGKKKYTMGKFYNIRIMDIRFPAPYIQTP